MSKQTVTGFIYSGWRTEAINRLKHKSLPDLNLKGVKSRGGALEPDKQPSSLTANLEQPPFCIVLDCGRKLDKSERTHTDTGENMQIRTES